MARIISQELDPNDKLDNLLAGDNVDNQKKKADGKLEEVKWDSIMEEAYSAIIKNKDFQNEVLAAKGTGNWVFDGTWPDGKGSKLDDIFDKYLLKSDLYKNLETQKTDELTRLKDLTKLSLDVLIINIRKDLVDIDLDSSDQAVFDAIKEIADAKAQNTNTNGDFKTDLEEIGEGKRDKNKNINDASDAKNDYAGDDVEVKKIWMDKMYKEKYETTTEIYDADWYASVSKKIENIYNNAKTRKVLERIFDGKDDEQEIRRETFRINLTLQDGLPSIILYLADMMDQQKNPSIKIKDEKIMLDEMYTKNSKNEVIGFNGWNAKKVKLFFKNYDPKGAKFDDYQKIAKILNNSSRQDLYTFATLLQSRSDLSTTVKQWNNALELTGNSRDDKTRTPEWEEKTSLVNAGKADKNGEYKNSNVFKYLCDFNSDNVLSGAPINLDKRKKQLSRKEQKNQGDVGNIFGQQLIFTLEQAIKVADATLLATPSDEKYRWENVVIQNILKNISIGDRRKWPKLDSKLADLISDPSKCTMPKLAELVNQHPEFKQLFRDAIEKINGGPDALSPDLLETLTGMDNTEILDTMSKERELKDEIDRAISHNPKLKLIIDKQWLVYVRNTIFTSIMSVLDHLQITTTDNGNNTNIRDYGVEKWIELNRVKNMLLQNVITNLVTMGLHGDPTHLRFMLWFAKYGQTPDGKVKRGFDISAGPNVDITDGQVSIIATVWGDVAFEYNYKKVINANLDAVKSAKYLGLEGRAMAGFDTKKLGIGFEASAGVEWLQDPVTGINQINDQYTKLSGLIFDAKEADQLDSVGDLRNYLDKRIAHYKSTSMYKDFLANNNKEFHANKDFILEYIEQNNIMAALDGKTIEEKRDAINSLLDVLQWGNIEQWRHDLIANLHGHVDLTKLSFGVTTSMLGRSGKQSGETEWSNQYAENPHTWSTNTGIEDRNAHKFSIYGFYVSARISTWRNHYVPQEKQWLMTQTEIAQGLGNTIDFASSDLSIYAKYIEAMYNSPNIKVSAKDGKLVIKSSSDVDIWTYLNIHVKKDDPDVTTDDEIAHNYMINSNTVTIGNVWDLWVYTVAEGDGVRRFLVIGSKGTDGTELVESIHSPTKSKNADGTAISPVKTGEEAIDPVARTTDYRAMQKQEIKDIVTKPDGLPQNAQDVVIKALDNKGVLTDSFGNQNIISSGTVNVTEKADGTMEITYLPDDALGNVVIEYNKELPGGATDVETITEKFDTKLLVYQDGSDLDNIIKNYLNDESFRKTIMEAENGSEGAYKSFLATVDTDLFTAKDFLKQVLARYENKGSTKSFVDLLDTLATTNDTDSLEALAVALDGVKTILALEFKYDGQSIATLLKARKDTFAGLKWPAGDQLPSTLQSLYRNDTWAKDTKKFGSIHKELRPNLIGYTAFYRYEKTWDHRRFSLTAPGSTRSLEGYINEVPADKQTAALDWFIKNLEANDHEFNLVKKSLEAYFLAKYPDISLSKQDVIDLITNKKIELTIDNKKLNVTLDATLVYYLLGECANESLGLLINSLTVVETKRYEDSEHKVVSWSAQTGYAMNFSAEWHSVPMRVQTEEMRIGVTHHQSIPTPKGKEWSDQYVWWSEEWSEGNQDAWDAWAGG